MHCVFTCYTRYSFVMELNKSQDAHKNNYYELLKYFTTNGAHYAK